MSIDLFLLAQGFVDVATLGMLTHTTSGQLYLYQPFKDDVHGDQLFNDLRWNLVRPQVASSPSSRDLSLHGARPTWHPVSHSRPEQCRGLTLPPIPMPSSCLLDSSLAEVRTMCVASILVPPGIQCISKACCRYLPSVASQRTLY